MEELEVEKEVLKAINEIIASLSLEEDSLINRDTLEKEINKELVKEK